MAARFVCVDHDTPLLMPPDLRVWWTLSEHGGFGIWAFVDSLMTGIGARRDAMGNSLR
jgi:hypothetical protein